MRRTWARTRSWGIPNHPQRPTHLSFRDPCRWAPAGQNFGHPQDNVNFSHRPTLTNHHRNLNHPAPSHQRQLSPGSNPPFQPPLPPPTPPLTATMARNAEKSQSMLYRFREAQAADLGIIDAGRTRRPRAITEQDSIPSCEKWRGQVLKEISRKVSRIHESSLSDYQIRDLNDEINKLMREKHVWEMQIRNLGGPNYMRAGAKVYDEAGREITGGGKGYRYFGRAKELPGVKELFEAAAKGREEKPLEERADLRKVVDAAYYGYAPGEEDEMLLAYERMREVQAEERLGEAKGSEATPPGWEPLPGDAGDGRGWELPTMDEVQQELIERRKRKLLDQL